MEVFRKVSTRGTVGTEVWRFAGRLQEAVVGLYVSDRLLDVERLLAKLLQVIHVALWCFGAATPIPTHPTQNPRSSVSCSAYCPVHSTPTKLDRETKQLPFLIAPKLDTLSSQSL